MDFEIEEEPSDFQFQSKWSKPSKSGGFLKGGFGSSKAAPEEDIYNYDFGGGGLGGDYEISHYSTPPSTDKFKKNEKSNSSSTEGGKISSAPAPAVSSQMSAMEKAQSMLNKYSKKATNAPANKKPTSFSNHNYLSTDYNEDDISIGSDELSTSGVMESPPPKATKGPQAKDTIKNNQPKEPIKQQLSRGFDLENDDDEDDELVSKISLLSLDYSIE